MANGEVRNLRSFGSLSALNLTQLSLFCLNLILKVASGRRKLLVLDVNGLLIDRYRRGERCPDRLHDGTVNRFLGTPSVLF